MEEGNQIRCLGLARSGYQGLLAPRGGRKDAEFLRALPQLVAQFGHDPKHGQAKAKGKGKQPHHSHPGVGPTPVASQQTKGKASRVCWPKPLLPTLRCLRLAYAAGSELSSSLRRPAGR